MYDKFKNKYYQYNEEISILNEYIKTENSYTEMFTNFYDNIIRVTPGIFVPGVVVCPSNAG